MSLVIKMSNKSKNKQNKICNFPYSNEVKQMKDEFKKMIDEMSDEAFLDFSFALMTFMDDFEDDWSEDEGWEDEAEKFYNNEKNNISNFPTKNEDLPF
jgi:hypothetical protein